MIFDKGYSQFSRCAGNINMYYTNNKNPIYVNHIGTFKNKKTTEVEKTLLVLQEKKIKEINLYNRLYNREKLYKKMNKINSKSGCGCFK